MPLKRRTADQKEAKQLEKQAAAEDAKRESEAQERDRQQHAYMTSPPGQARTAFENGDDLFQTSFSVMSQQAIIIAMVGGTTKQRANDPTAILNAICREGWEFVNGSFVFVEQGQESRDKFLASGQNVAIKGTTVGYYLFRRCEANKRDVRLPWEVPEQAESVETAATSDPEDAWRKEPSA
jgi:hypothetical protein